MATATTKVLCRYFMNGACSKGQLCTFSHEWSDHPDMVCRYYLQGHCRYGDKCRYDHIRPKHKSQANPSADEPKPKKLGPSLGPVLLPSQSGGEGKTENNAHQPKKLGSSLGPVLLPSQSGGEGKTENNAHQPKLVALKRDPSKLPKQWVQAPEFKPGRRYHGTDETETGTMWEPRLDQATYSGVAGIGLETGEEEFLDIITTEEAASLMCPFAEMGDCPFGESCEYRHGDLCEMCGRECLSPFDPEQRKAHHRECLKAHEEEMEHAFAVQKSEGKSCGICMEVVLSKVSLSDRRFGILSDCDHCFCIGCIRKWRGLTHTRKRTIRACPLCRKVSYFVIPSQVWVDEGEEKQKLIDQYKSNLSQQHCKHFNRGEGTCPFGNSCFYKHEYPDGTKATVQPRVAVNDLGEGKFVGEQILWAFIEERDSQYTNLEDRNEENWSSSSDSDDDPFL